jgi:hypothetical protein
MISHSARKYEDTGPEKVARDAARRHAHESDPSEKLAREVDQSPTCDNGLVPDQKKHRDHTVAVRKVLHGASYENALKTYKLDAASGEISRDFFIAFSP